MSLKISLLNTNKVWYYGHPEARNMRGNFVGVDVKIDDTQSRGLYSLDGFVSIDDSKSKEA